MIIWTIDPVIAYCMQICMHVQFYWGGTGNTVHITGCKITAVAFFVHIGKSWMVLEYTTMHLIIKSIS